MTAGAETGADPGRVTGGEPPAPTGEPTISQAGERRSMRIESLRGLPAMIVVAEHVFIISLARTSGGTGPDPLDIALEMGRVFVFFFFALSGYLMFWPFARSYFRAREPISLRQYALNRAFRVLPLYWAVVGVMMVLRAEGESLGDWLRFLTFTQNFSVETAQLSNFLNAPMWTMLLELQFYIALPFVAYFLARATASRIAPAVVLLVALGTIGLFLRLDLLRLSDDPGQLVGVSMPATFYFFIPGMLLGLARVAWERDRPGWMSGALGRADVWLLASIPFWVLAPLPFENGLASQVPGCGVETCASENLDFLVGPAAFLVLGAVVLPLSAGRLTRALDWRPLAVVGIASYSIYMWHYPILTALQRSDWFPDGFWEMAFLGAPLAILAGLVSYRFIEAPFLGLRKQWARSSARQEEPEAKAPEIASRGPE